MAAATQTSVIFPWMESYSVGFPAIDTQHKTLIRLINELHAGMSAGKGKQALGKILDDLVKYTESHFAYEEQMLKQKEYSKLAAHRSVHARLTREVIELRDRHRNAQLTITIQVMTFLKSWLADHIMVHDQAYARELK
jgi:hemerythrin